MKTTFWVVVVLCCLAVAFPAQSQPASVEGTTADRSSALQIGEIGDHHRVWERVTMETDRYDNKIYHTNVAYTELETGMNVKQPDGSWVAASDEIEIVKDGAIARKGRHRVGFAVNCNSPVAIDMLTADGKRLQSRILGLAYTDKATGESVLIAELKDSEGQLLMDTKNEVIYYDAFSDLVCDIRYKNSKAGLEQDLILRENPPSPADYKLNPATTVLEVLTEFFSPPVPVKQTQLTDGAVNELLDFGDLKMGNGRVYVMGQETAAIPVTKQWATLDGRTFLVEQIPFPKVSPELKRLPARTAFSPAAPEGVRHQVASRRLLPTIKPARKATGPMRMASAPLSGRGVVLDYTTASSATNYTFKGDTTYYVSGTVNLSGTNTVFEGGAVLKYSPTNTPKLNITSPITWLGSAYRPVVMTGKNDNTTGETISGSTGNPNTNYFANPALYIDGTAAGTNAILQNLRIAFAQSAIVFNGKTGHVVSHAQLVNCASGFSATNAEFSLRNALLYNVLTNFNGSSSTGRCEHLTVNTANWLNCNSAITLTMTNSLLVSVTNGGSFTSNSVSTATASAFQTVGAGSHYLAASSTNRNVGTTNINASLAADLKKLTTYPPLVLTNHFTANTTLNSQAQRDTDTPDLGWHYDPLDYCWAALNLTSATLLLTNGVAVANLPGTNANQILYILSNGKLISEGSPTQFNRMVRYNTVQEQAVTNSINNGTFVYVDVNATTPDIRCRFTDWSALSGSGNHLTAYYTPSPVKFTDCRFSASQLFLKGCPVGFTNCLWERVLVDLKDDDTGVSRHLYNNLLRGGGLTLYQGAAGICQVRDNLFDQTTISQTGTNFYDHNGYVTNYSRLSPNGTGDVVLTNAPIYQSSFLGRYYYPTNGGLLSTLLNVGSRNATNAGLYHYTLTTNQVKEASSTVDIGFHYVATGANGLPLDTDGDGQADYTEDKNGNGVFDAGDTANWLSSDLDTDGDGVSDGIELYQGRNPNSPTLPGSVTDTNTLTGLRVFTPFK